jgi:hypothetical protein
MGLLFTSAGGGDLTELNIFQGQSGTYVVVADNTYEDLINITGKGYLSFCLVRKSGAGTGGVKITVDGTSLFEAVNNDNTRAVGIANVSQLYQFTSADTAIRHVDVNNPFSVQGATANAFKALPHSATEAMSVIASPIWFNSSLKIEVKYITTANLIVYYEGAYI